MNLFFFRHDLVMDVTTMFRNGRKCFMNRPLLKSICERVFVYAQHFSPDRKALSYAVMRKIQRISHVPLLSFCIAPSAILRAIVSVCIDSIERCSFWAFPHVRKEKSEIEQPPFTNRYSSSTISWVIGGILIRAPIFHHGPSCVGSGSRCVRGVIMFCMHYLVYQIKHVCQANGAVMAGLTTRRRDEAILFET